VNVCVPVCVSVVRLNFLYHFYRFYAAALCEINYIKIAFFGRKFAPDRYIMLTAKRDHRNKTTPCIQPCKKSSLFNQCQTDSMARMFGRFAALTETERRYISLQRRLAVERVKRRSLCAIRSNLSLSDMTVFIERNSSRGSPLNIVSVYTVRSDCHDDTQCFSSSKMTTPDEKNCHRSRIEVRPTALLRYHAHTRWTLTLDHDQ